MVLRSLHRLSPQALRFLSVDLQERLLLVDSRGGLPIALSSFPGLPICLRRQSDWTSIVRLSESIVAGRSVTSSNIPCKAVLKHGV